MPLRPNLEVLLGALLIGLVSNHARAAEAAASTAGAPASATGGSEESANHLSELFYANAEVGAEYVGLESLHLTRALVPSTVSTSAVGPIVGFGAGFRLVFVTLGPRFRYGIFRDWDLWTLNGELGFRAPLGALEPFLLFSAGFAKLGRLQKNDVQVTGYDIRIGAGFDYYFGRHFSIGAFATGEVLGLARPGVNLNESTGSLEDDLLQYDGSSVGAAVTGSALIGVHL